jgi:hypothetical protein
VNPVSGVKALVIFVGRTWLKKKEKERNCRENFKALEKAASLSYGWCRWDERQGKGTTRRTTSRGFSGACSLNLSGALA